MLKPLVTQVWPQFTADEQFTASFSNVFVERVELFRSARKVIICLRSTEPLATRPPSPGKMGISI